MKIKVPARNIKIFLVVFVLLFQFLHVSAQIKLSDSIVKERIRSIEKMLNDGKANANRWWYGWLIGYSALSVAQGAGYFLSDDPDAKMDWAFGSLSTLVGVTTQVFYPMTPGIAPDHLARLPENNTDDALKKLSVAEDFLKCSALREKKGRSWRLHTLYGLINVGGGLVSIIAFKQPFWGEFRNFAINTVVSEAQIFTQPTKAMKDYQYYCRKYKAGETLEVYKPKAEWHVSAYPGGVVVSLVF
jgi:hypothetical protein